MEMEFNIEDLMKIFMGYNKMFCDGICQIISEGEPTDIGRKVTIDRIKEYCGYEEWLDV